MMEGRFFSREREQIETTPGVGRLPEEEWRKSSSLSIVPSRVYRYLPLC